MANATTASRRTHPACRHAHMAGRQTHPACWRPSGRAAYGHVSLAQAVALGGGVALFLAGDMLFRRILRFGRPGYRLVALAGALASIPLGLVLAAGQIALLLVVLAVPLSIEGYRELRPAGVTAGIWRR